MFEFLEKAALTALGAAALTQKKGEELVDELKSRYKMSEEEGRVILDRIQEILRMGRERSAELAEAEVRNILDRMGMVSREEFEMLKRRVDALEAQRTPQGLEEPGPEC